MSISLKDKVVLITGASSGFGEDTARLFAKRPRRSLVIPWWFRVITMFDTLFPVLVDWILYWLSKKNHDLD